MITTHTGCKQTKSTDDLDISIQIIGDKGRTNFVPLLHSLLNKRAFIAGRKDLFRIHASNVGTVCDLNLLNEFAAFIIISNDGII